MAELRLYREFICFSQNSETLEGSHINITPTELTVYTSGATGIIENLTPIEDILGRYYVTMDLVKYDLSVVHQLIWEVNYTPEAPTKNLITRFKVDYRFDLGSELNIEIIDSNIEVVLVENETIEVIDNNVEIIFDNEVNQDFDDGDIEIVIDNNII